MTADDLLQTSIPKQAHGARPGFLVVRDPRLPTWARVHDLHFSCRNTWRGRERARSSAATRDSARSDPDTVRLPDVAFISRSDSRTRNPRLPRFRPPDLVVRSLLARRPTWRNTPRSADWLEGGARLVGSSTAERACLGCSGRTARKRTWRRPARSTARTATGLLLQSHVNLVEL